MTTYYVSQTATNGFAIGSDSNTAGQAQSQATPWLTVDKFYASSSDGDIVIINDGIYTAAVAYNINRALTFTANTIGQVTFRTQAGQAAVINSGLAAGKVLSFNGIIFDAQNVNNYAHNTDSSSVTINWTDCVFKDALLQCCRLNSASGKYTLVRCTVTGASTDGGVVHNGPGSGSVIVIDDLYVNLTNITQNAGSVYLQGAATGSTAYIRNVYGEQVNVGATVLAGIQTYNISRLAIIGSGKGDVGPRLKVTAASSAAACVKVLARISIASDRPVINGFRGWLNTVSDGYGIIVGTDGSGGGTVDNFITDPVIINCDIIGNPSNSTSHGLMIGSQIGGFVANNRVRAFGIPIISKLQATRGMISVNNDIDFSVTAGAGAIYSKGSLAGSAHFMNNIHISSGYAPQAFQSLRDNVSLVVDTGSVYAFNNIYSTVQVSTMATVGTGVDLSTATFACNNYNLSAGVTGTPFSYQGVGYATVALWAAAQELTARTETPTNQDATYFKYSYLPRVRQMVWKTSPAMAIGVGLQ